MREVDPDGIPDTLRAAGVAGAGGAGFPSYVKWQALEDLDHLLVNHQESEPNYYADKWLARENADALGDFLRSLLDTAFDGVVVGTKAKYREDWTEPFEARTDATVYTPGDLPIDAAEERGVTFAYTPNVYTYSEESVLLMVTAGVQIDDDLPTEHGWIVHNTETLYNIYRAIVDGTPVTRKYVHVDGNTPRHRCLEVPVGTPASTLLEAGGVDGGEVADDQILADGGPGWCYEIDLPPDEFGVRKRTNAVLVLHKDVTGEHTEDDGQVDVLDVYDWDEGDHETEPTRVEPDSVRIPLITNAAYTGFVAPSDPVVERGERVSEGDRIASPGEGISNAQHASIDGTVADITDTHIVIERP